MKKKEDSKTTHIRVQFITIPRISSSSFLLTLRYYVTKNNILIRSFCWFHSRIGNTFALKSCRDFKKGTRIIYKKKKLNKKKKYIYYIQHCTHKNRSVSIYYFLNEWIGEFNVKIDLFFFERKLFWFFLRYSSCSFMFFIFC